MKTQKNMTDNDYQKLMQEITQKLKSGDGNDISDLLFSLDLE